MQIGIDSFGAVISDPATGISLSPIERIENLLEEIEFADQVDLDVFGIGEHHRAEFVDSAPAVILGAAARRTKNIRLSSAVTVLSAADPVRVFQEFATLDLISHGRAEIVAGRGSSIEAFPLFGLDLDDYDSLFSEKLDLLLKIRERMVNTVRLSTDKPFIHVRRKTRYRFGLGWAALRLPLFAPGCWGFR
jgi:alkanesulfonate monooxygenase SsuD/methylene tetrahydromethanopterin reductase-like flavin-dependent oxidoreductase (luciferase family)